MESPVTHDLWQKEKLGLCLNSLFLLTVLVKPAQFSHENNSKVANHLCCKITSTQDWERHWEGMHVTRFNNIASFISLKASPDCRLHTSCEHGNHCKWPG